MKKTKYVRVKLDYVLAFDGEFDTLPKPMLAITKKGVARSLVTDGLAKFARSRKMSCALVATNYDVKLIHPKTRKRAT